MSTSPTTISRQETQHALAAAYLNARTNSDRLRDFIVHYYNGVDPRTLLLVAEDVVAIGRLGDRKVTKRRSIAAALGDSKGMSAALARHKSTLRSELAWGKAIMAPQDRSPTISPRTRMAYRAATFVERVAQELRNEHFAFKRAVRWLCSPKSAGPDIEAFGKMMASGRAFHMRHGRYPFIHANDERFVQYFEKHGLKHAEYSLMLDGDKLALVRPYIHHHVDLLCAYLVDECNDRSLSEITLKVCRKCEKLFSSRVKSKKYCSDKCRQKFFWPDERHRDYNKVCRWEDRAARCFKPGTGFGVKDLERLEKRTSKNHALDKIAARWKAWPKLTERVRRIWAAFDKLHTGR